MRYRHSESRTLRLTLQSLWHWDLWIANPFGVGVGLLWFLSDPNPRWEWFLPVATLSVAFLGMVWYQWNTLRSRLEESSYGELVRITDSSETEVRLPYTITIGVALASTIWSTVTAILIEDINSTLGEAVLVYFTSTLAMWLMLSVVSLVLLAIEHDRNMARVASIREQMDAAQRRYGAEKDRASTLNTEEAE